MTKRVQQPRATHRRSKKYLKKCNAIHTLFDSVTNEVGVREWVIFKAVYKDKKEAWEKLGHFLKNVGDCPPEVVVFCRELLTGRRKIY